MTHVLVAYASKRGSTGEIAESIADVLRQSKLEVDCKPAGEVESLNCYDGVVLGSAVYMKRWRGDAKHFLRKHEAAVSRFYRTVVAGDYQSPAALTCVERFKKNRDKLFFFTGFEYFYQVLDTGLLRATVPTPGMLTGNFSPSEIAKIGPYAASGAPPGQLTAAALAQFPGGMIPSSMLDPNMVALMKLLSLIHISEPTRPY